MTFTPKDAAELITKETSNVNSLWQNYATVSGVLLAFGIWGATFPWGARLAATIAFVIFSFGNLALIVKIARVQEAAVAVLDGMDDKAEEDPTGILSALAASVNTEKRCRTYHFVIDVAVIAAIWVPALLKTSA